MPNVWVDNNHSVGTQFEENIWTKQRFTFCTVDDQLSSENTKKYYFYVRVPYIKYIDYIIQFMMKWRKNKILMYIIYIIYIVLTLLSVPSDSEVGGSGDEVVTSGTRFKGR